MGRFYGVATKYLHHYLGCRRLLDLFKGSVIAEQFLYHALRQNMSTHNLNTACNHGDGDERR